jgi:hypothetical protein
MRLLHTHMKKAKNSEEEEDVLRYTWFRRFVTNFSSKLMRCTRQSLPMNVTRALKVPISMYTIVTQPLKSIALLWEVRICYELVAHCTYIGVCQKGPSPKRLSSFEDRLRSREASCS